MKASMPSKSSAASTSPALFISPVALHAMKFWQSHQDKFQTVHDYSGDDWPDSIPVGAIWHVTDQSCFIDHLCFECHGAWPCLVQLLLTSAKMLVENGCED
jgi:hypothetical protein